MLSKIIEKIRTRIAVRQLDQLPSIGIGRQAIAEYFTKNIDVTKNLPPEFVQREAERMMEEVIRVATSADPKKRRTERC